MEKVRVILMIILSLVLFGCGQSNGSKSPDNDEVIRDRPEDTTDIVSLKNCEDGAEEKSLIGTWGGGERSSQHYKNLRYIFSENELHINRRCFFLGTVFMMSGVGSEYTKSDDAIETLKDDKYVSTFNYKDKVTYNCSLEIKPSTKPYLFIGSCLAVSGENGDVILLKRREDEEPMKNWLKQNDQQTESKGNKNEEYN